jgi:hypothetical protein
VQIVCCNGLFTQNITSPCFDVDYPEIVSGFVVSVYSNKTGIEVYRETVAYSTVQSSCFLDGTSVTCAVPFTRLTQVQPYGYYNLHGKHSANIPTIINHYVQMCYCDCDCDSDFDFDCDHSDFAIWISLDHFQAKHFPNSFDHQSICDTSSVQSIL